ncbi:hypothetical protein POM88_031043 [Heracleum sosnowskyi]|uniref:Uncharacterized protein n=1 Tax=Heracleum sosnowskyi TaxID=360622 RepID=A0AAD8MGA0_9APIA|nr:hypothetical protein POM88_031043 [Heracleum sosnowskyi]
MPATFQQGSFLNRISIRRNQVVSMTDHNTELPDFDFFQNKVSDILAGIVPGVGQSDAVLSVAWFRKLLDVFLCCETEFKVVVLMGRDPAQLSKAPMDRVLQEYMDRVVKALDICNAVTHAVDLVRHWQQLAEIGVEALQQRPIGGGHVRRAKKALNSLVMSMNFDDEYKCNAKSADRAWSFGRRGTPAAAAAPLRNQSSNFRSLSFPFSNSWSSAKQIQLMSANMVVPRGGDAGGLALPVYIMSSIMVFTMWALVAAFPCQDRNGLPAHLPIGKPMGWAEPIVLMQEKIGEEWKKQDKMNVGLLEESQRLEKVAVFLVDYDFSTEGEMEDEMAEKVAELAEICGKMDEGLGALEQGVREVFHSLAKSRTENRS